MKKCSIDGCERPFYGRGYCNMHWQRWRSRGHAAGMFKMRAPNGAPRAWIRENVFYSGQGCLIWPFARRENGWPKMGGGSPSRMMCELANGPAPTRKHHAAHSCGNGDLGCLSPKHLRWATATENAADKVIHGTLLKGEKITQAKLTSADVLAIRVLITSSSRREIADYFGVSRPTISRIISGRTWGHVR